MAARVNIIITDTVANLNACCVFWITTATTEITTKDPIKEAGAIIQGISFASVAINCILVSWTLKFGCRRQSRGCFIFAYGLSGNICGPAFGLMGENATIPCRSVSCIKLKQQPCQTSSF